MLGDVSATGFDGILFAGPAPVDIRAQPRLELGALAWQTPNTVLAGQTISFEVQLTVGALIP
ncbi:hypothetical protein [Streptomyces sp. NPDC001100]